MPQFDVASNNVSLRLSKLAPAAHLETHRKIRRDWQEQANATIRASGNHPPTLMVVHMLGAIGGIRWSHYRHMYYT